MKHIDKFSSLEDSLERKRLERLRNLLTPFLLLPELVKNKDIPGKMVLETADTCLEIVPLIQKALSEDVTLDELKELYL